MEPNEDTVIGLAETASGLPDESSLLDALEEERREEGDDYEHDFRVPGYNAVAIYARYRRIEGKDLHRIGKSVSKQERDEYERVLYASVDSFIKACVGFSYERDGQERKPLTWEGRPVTGYTVDLARALGFADKLDPAGSSRSIVFGLFKGNEIAIMQHNIALGRWMAGVNVEVDEGLFGGNP